MSSSKCIASKSVQKDGKHRKSWDITIAMKEVTAEAHHIVTSVGRSLILACDRGREWKPLERAYPRSVRWDY